jgi:hypothetical protein
MAFSPFMQSSQAQTVINDYLDGKMEPVTNVNSAGNFRNPLFDLRTEQELAGELDPSALYPNSIADFSVEDTTPDPCQEGFMLVDGICQPIETFGQSMYDENKNDRDDPEERPYMSIEDMKNASDKELLDYMTSGFLKNSPLGYLPSKGTEVTMSNMFLPSQFQLLFGNQNEMRKNFIKDELTRRGYFTGNFDKNNKAIFDIGNKNVNTNVGGIESLLPANVQGQAVTDAFGDTYQQTYNSGTGDIGYTFTPATPLPAVSQQTQGGVNYGTGRGGTSSNQMTGGGTVIIGGNAFNPDINPEDDYNDPSSGI